MFKMIATALLLAAATVAVAQAPKADAPARKGYDCSQAKDPKACEERREKRREMMKSRHEKHNAAFDKGYDACKGKATGAEFRACMRTAGERVLPGLCKVAA